MRKASSYCADPGRDLGVVDRPVAEPVQRRRPRRCTSRWRARDTPGGLFEVVHRVAAGVELDALVLAGQEAAVPLPGRDRLRAAAAGRVGGHHDEAGQVVALAAQAVGDPRAHARPALDRRARVHERVRRVVVDLVGVHRADDAEVVGMAGDVREEAR